MQILDRLKQDHRKVAETLEKLEQGAGKDREKLFSELKQDLEIHAMFEEEFFYPRIAEKAKDEIDHAVEEHDEVTSLLEEMHELGVADQAFAENLQELKQGIEEHVGEEESRIFELAREVFDDKEAEELGRKYEEAKQSLLKKSA